MFLGSIIKIFNSFRMEPSDSPIVVEVVPEVTAEPVVEAVQENVEVTTPVSETDGQVEREAGAVTHVIFDVGDGTFFWKSSRDGEFVKKSGFFKSRQDAEADMTADAASYQ